MLEEVIIVVYIVRVDVILGISGRQCRGHSPIRLLMMVDSVLEAVVLFQRLFDSIRYRIYDRFNHLRYFVVSFEIGGRAYLAAILWMFNVDEDLLLFFFLGLIRRCLPVWTEKRIMTA